MSGLAEGSTHAQRSIANPMYMSNPDMGLHGGGTVTGTSTMPTIEQYENIFGPAGRDIKLDSQRHKRHQRWHLPDALKGANNYLTDRVDGLITDSTNSPFTRNILPYVYLEQPDQKLKWNVYSFDEGIASRVPYEAAARVLPQSKRSFAGYTVRQGLAIAMEHNFMVSAAGRENFKNQLQQLVGSIQLTNDLDVHVALLQAPSHQKHMNEKYHDNFKSTTQICREYVDLFGFMQKTPNALDILIEDAKNHLKTWGSQPPTFLLCNGALTAQLNMLPERTNYLTNGPDGKARLAAGPELPSYRGLNIINSRKFSMDAGTAPRDLLRRRVRVAEYYRIPYTDDNINRSYEFYDQSRDSMFRLTWEELVQAARINDSTTTNQNDFWFETDTPDHQIRGIPTSKPYLYLGGRYVIDGGNDWKLTLPAPISKQGAAYMCPQKDLMNPGSDLEFNFTDSNVHEQCEEFNGLKVNHSYKLLESDAPHFLKSNKIFRSLGETFGVGLFNDTAKSNDPQKALQLGEFSRNNSNRLSYSSYLDWDSAANATGTQLQTWVSAHIMLDMTQKPPQFSMQNNKHDYIIDMSCLETHVRQGSGLVTSPHLINAMFVFHFLRTDGAAGFNVENASEAIQNKYNLFQATQATAGNNIGLPQADHNRNFFHSGSNNYQDIAKFRFTMAHLEIEHKKMFWFKLFWEWCSNSMHKDFKLQHVVDVANLNQGIDGGFANFTAAMADVGTTPADITRLLNRFKQQCGPFSDNVVNDNFNVEQMWTSYATKGAILRLFWAPTNPDEIGEILKNIRVNLNMSSVEAMNLQYNICQDFHNDKLHGVKTQGNTFEQCGVLRHSLIAWNRYYQVMAQWAGDIFARRMWAILEPNNCPEGSDVEMHKCYDDVQHAIKTDCLAQTADIGKTTTVAWLVEEDLTRNMKEKFRAARMSNDLCYRMASNVQNSNAMIQAFKPNLHLSKAQPLSSSDMEYSPTSLDNISWLVQAIAGMMFMTPEMCDVLMSNVNPEQSMKNHMKRALSLNVGNEYDFLKTFLACEWLSSMFPAKIGSSARKDAIPVPCQIELCNALAEAIDNNCRWSSRLQDAVSNLNGCQSSSSPIASTACCVEAAALSNLYIPRNGGMDGVSHDNWTCGEVRWEDMDICDAIPYAVPLASLKIECPACNPAPITERPSLDHAKRADWLQVPGVQAKANYDTIRRWSTPFNVPESDMSKVNSWYDTSSWWQPSEKYRWIKCLGLSGMHNQKSKLGSHSFPISLNEAATDKTKCGALYDSSVSMAAHDAAEFCRNPNNRTTIMQHVLAVWAARFFKPTSRFFENGQGKVLPVLAKMPEDPAFGVNYAQKNCGLAKVQKFIRPGAHFMHGPNLGVTDYSSSGDIVILRPNIEHEMLGIIMGRGGTQELGATFWGQTELSCYDDAQHGIWGMSYKYHERAMVTNERNLIRVFDVAFDGYNGGMDQKIVEWNNPDSKLKFREATYARDKPYDGPSMLVMQLPASGKNIKNWPNPIVFHNGSDSMSASPDPQKDAALPNLNEHMVFSHQRCSSMCTPAVESKFAEYMRNLDMQMWGSIDQSGRPAGECCISGETASQMLAFQGTMNVYNKQNGSLIDAVHGSGHLGQSYVGVASVREGRGMSQVAAMPSLVRQV